MKLSFSTNYWHNYSFEDFIVIAGEYKFQGIEIHDVRRIFQNNASEAGQLTALYRKLFEEKLTVSCVDLVNDIAEDAQAALTELASALEVAKRLHAPYIRIKTSQDTDEAEERACVI